MNKYNISEAEALILEENNIPEKLFRNRCYNHWDKEKAMTWPVRQKREMTLISLVALPELTTINSYRLMDCSFIKQQCFFRWNALFKLYGLTAFLDVYTETPPEYDEFIEQVRLSLIKNWKPFVFDPEKKANKPTQCNLHCSRIVLWASKEAYRIVFLKHAQVLYPQITSRYMNYYISIRKVNCEVTDSYEKVSSTLKANGYKTTYPLKTFNKLREILGVETIPSVFDHEGNGFKSTKEMCEYWNISTACYRTRINQMHLSVKDALTLPKKFK